MYWCSISSDEDTAPAYCGEEGAKYKNKVDLLSNLDSSLNLGPLVNERISKKVKIYSYLSR